MPIEPIDPSKKPDGDGREKYAPEEKRGPGKFDEALDKAKVDRAKAEASKMAEEHRAKVEAERPRTYAERLQDMGRLPKPTGGGGGGMGGNKLSNRDLTKAYKAGGKVKKYESGGSMRVDRSPKYSNSQMASVREQLDKNEKAAKPEHDKNVERYNKAMDEVTKRTQPGMAKMNPMGDTYKKGGKVSSASKRADGCCIRGKTKA